MSELSKPEPTIKSLVKNALEDRVTIVDVMDAEEQQRMDQARDEENLNIETD